MSNSAEDPQRVIYPLLSEFLSFRAVDVSSIVIETDTFGNHIFRVIIRKELKSLEHFRNSPYIIQPAGVVVDNNPYVTLKEAEHPLVILRILTEFCYGDSLEQILDENILGDSVSDQGCTEPSPRQRANAYGYTE
ncbi:hypothetical protein AJ80_07975 [Polytolypa hystricis UAMH7299]|uniref:Uncharacterized protein n=1 Tax=Polytolypa hystricis (strain UAMH7299) TaxID=1447883 RepID=A0A2B7XEL2_POLH7|nr:hypothetical protein AJ80_07975 [Polytolypa hystricis UAMH7299]